MTVEHGVDVDTGFTAFYEREHAGQVRRAALLVGSADTAHDVVHDAMVEIYARWNSIEQPAAYLTRAVVNRCRDHGRRATTHRRLLDRLAPRPDVAEPEEPLWDLVASLPFNQRAALVLRFYAGFSIAGIADALGCSQGSVGPWIDRALTTLRRQLP